MKCSLAALAFPLLSLMALPVFADSPAPLLHEGDKIVFIGDSITGQGAIGEGYVNVFRNALAKTHPRGHYNILALGGSGHTVGSWVGIEKNSRLKVTHLDNPDVDVKATLDDGAQVVVIMLGMNNVLRPDMSNTPEAVTKWVATYRELIRALRERTGARVIALATPTQCGEDEGSPKNQLMDDMGKALIQLAAEEKCVVLPVRERFGQALHDGRTYRPDFHIEVDFVHPSGAGHLAIAAGMLEGLGESATAKAVYEQAAAKWKIESASAPVISYEVRPSTVAGTDLQTFKVKAWISAKAQLSITVPEGWKAAPATIEGTAAEFTVTGSPDRLRNTLKLVARQGGIETKSDIVISAPWLIGIGSNGRAGWINDKGFTFDPVQGQTPVDDSLRRGIGFDKPSTDPKWNHPAPWQPYFASVNYTGGNDPGSIDLSAVSWFNTFDVAYGARWIYSASDRPVPIQIDSDAFTTGNFLTIWSNGDKVWESATRRGFSNLQLRKGWNVVVFRSNHLEWQWQFDIKLVPVPLDDLGDLRFSIVPHDIAKP